MKFLSFDNFFIMLSAGLTANFILSDVEWMRLFGTGLVIYGIMLINRRVMAVMRKLGMEE